MQLRGENPSLQRKTARHLAGRKCQKSNIKITVKPAAAPRFHLRDAAIVNFDMSLRFLHS
jgi:hypothetical protein